MITLKEGSKERLPYVEVKITTGRYWVQYWFEVHYWNEKEQCWYHDYKRDGGGFGLWFVVRKANRALSDCLYELMINEDN